MAGLLNKIFQKLRAAPRAKSVDEIVQAGIEAAESETMKAIQAKKANLATAYNAASGVIEGLEAIKNRPGSKFSYEVSENFVYDLSIRTNIPVLNYNGRPETLSIFFGDGKIRALGDRFRQATDESVVTQYNNKVAPIVGFVAKKAALKGLIS